MKYAALLIFVLAVTVPANAGTTAYEPGYDPGVGFNLVSWWNFGGGGNSVWENAVQEVYDAGFDEVSISPVRFINTATGSIATSSGRGPELAHIAAGIVRAKSLGMRVTVNPFVEPENFTFWRGDYDPTPGSSQSNTFWSDYEQYLVDVAEVAQANGADAMNIGTELKDLTQNSGNNADWTSVISAVDAEFTGSLGYAANWDNYSNGNLTSTIWDNPAIDYLGIDAYFRNTVTNAQADASGSDPNETFIEQVEQGWNDRLDNEILPFAAARQSGTGLPVVFSEVGYLPYNRTAATPQSSSGSVDSDEQVMAFKGLMRALDGRADALSAVHIWQWGMPGSSGSLWNIDTDLPADQPNNLAAGQWLSSFVSGPVLSGDYNNDGIVDTADYTVWRDNLGAAPGTLPNDPDGGVIGAAQYNTWRDRFGLTFATSLSQTVPEPHALLLLAFSLAAVSAAPSRR